MALVVTLIIGGIIGWLASIVMKTNAQMGMIANVVVGIVGSWLGAWIAARTGIGGRGLDRRVRRLAGWRHRPHLGAAGAGHLQGLTGGAGRRGLLS